VRRRGPPVPAFLLPARVTVTAAHGCWARIGELFHVKPRAYEPSAIARTAAANASTSASVVSKAVIHRTT
jgi:hypothetical protein